MLHLSCASFTLSRENDRKNWACGEITLHSNRDRRVWTLIWQQKLQLDKREIFHGFWGAAGVNWPTSERSIGSERQYWVKLVRVTLHQKPLKKPLLFVMNLIHADFNNNKMSRHLYKCKKKRVTVLQIGFTLFLWMRYDFSSIISSIRRMNGPSWAQSYIHFTFSMIE